jgi:hypothetical protein
MSNAKRPPRVDTYGMFRRLIPPSVSNLRALLLSLALVSGVVALACGGGDTQGGAASDGIVVKIPSPTGEATAKPRKTTAPSVTPSPAPLKVCAPNPDPAHSSLLQIEEPKPDQQVKVPIHVRGWGSNIGFEDKGVALAIVNAKQEVIQVLDLPPQPRTYRVAPPGLEITENAKPFAADVVISNINEPTSFCLWVYQETTETGTPKGVVQVPVVVLP